MVKNLRGLIVMLAAFLIGISPSFVRFSTQVEQAVVPAIVEDNEVYSNVMVNDHSSEFSKHNFNAWYILERYRGMEEVILVSISREFDQTVGKNNRSGTRAAIHTNLENYGNEGVFEDVEAEIDSHHAKFRTEKRKGVESRFDGTFSKDRAIGDADEKLLIGTIEKFVNGKKVAAVSGDFAYREPHCWH